MIDKLKEKVLLSEEMGAYTKLKKRGESFWGCCVFHSEKTPSMVVNDNKKFFYCFGCGMKGDVFSFYKEYLKHDFKDTLEILCKKYGFKKFYVKNNQVEVQRIEEILQIALENYQNNLKTNEIAQNYLKTRKLSENTIKEFQIGYADDSNLVKILFNKGFSLSEIKKSGINSYGSLDRFRNRIVFPILSKSKKIIGFAGRVLDKSLPKYINSSETELFQKNLHLYNEHNLVNNAPIILVEGYLDVITMTQHGIKNVVASMGTSLSPAQVFSIFKHTNTLFLMFDGDTSGQKAVERNIEVCLQVLKPGQQVMICKLPNNQDPDQIINDAILPDISIIFNQSENLLDWKWKHLLSKFDYSVNSMSQLLENIENFLVEIKNKNVRIAYKLFFNQKLNDLKKNLKQNYTTSTTINSDDLIMNIIINKPSIIDHLIEDLMDFQFTDKNYELIRNEIIEDITLKKDLSAEVIIQNIIRKHDRFLDKLIQSKNFSYVVQNEKFALQYVRDIIFTAKNQPKIPVKTP